MRKPISDADIELVAAKISRDIPHVCASKEFIWTALPPIQIVDCVLSLNRHYDRFVLPRVKRFSQNRPDIRRCKDLLRDIESCRSPADFVSKELNYVHAARATTLHQVVRFVCTLVPDECTETDEISRLKDWACHSRPHVSKSLGIRGFGLAGFQYLRMLFGAETTKPDVHIKRFVSKAVSRSVSDVHALTMLEAAAEISNVSLRWLDASIWEQSARRDPATG